MCDFDWQQEVSIKATVGESHTFLDNKEEVGKLEAVCMAGENVR